MPTRPHSARPPVPGGLSYEIICLYNIGPSVAVTLVVVLSILKTYSGFLSSAARYVYASSRSAAGRRIGPTKWRFQNQTAAFELAVT